MLAESDRKHGTEISSKFTANIEAAAVLLAASAAWSRVGGSVDFDRAVLLCWFAPVGFALFPGLNFDASWRSRASSFTVQACLAL